MIFFARGGGGGLWVVLLFGALLLFSSGGRGGAFPLLFLLLFVVVPFLFIRSASRSVRVVHRGQWRTTYPRQQPQRRRPPPVDPADVQTVVARLAHDVRTLDAGDDPVARQAMADASERHATASSLLERARSDDVLRTAWLAAAEGLHATRLVRTRRGLDPGPAPHLPPSTGPQLDRPATVTVAGRQHVGTPTYTPGNRHWFPGGRVDDTYVPGGWYRAPFWPGDLVLGALSFWALGSLLAGDGGFGGGFDDGVDGDVDGGGDGADGGWDEGGADAGGGWGGEGAGDGGWGDGGSGWDGGTQWGGGWGDGGGGWGDGGGDFGGDVGGDFGGDW